MFYEKYKIFSKAAYVIDSKFKIYQKINISKKLEKLEKSEIFKLKIRISWLQPYKQMIIQYNYFIKRSVRINFIYKD